MLALPVSMRQKTIGKLRGEREWKYDIDRTGRGGLRGGKEQCAAEKSEPRRWRVGRRRGGGRGKQEGGFGER